MKYIIICKNPTQYFITSKRALRGNSHSWILSKEQKDSAKFLSLHSARIFLFKEKPFWNILDVYIKCII